ncbi:MAG: urea ABC transporter permease subunit UrtB, partial [Anaerolineae bacterium]|nr:urea ABC transporter permease subunit UrtB [Anaerolineae bacterium]
MESLLAQIFNGLSLGSILLLAALGLAFSFGLMKVINMAHGEFIMVGAYVTYGMQMFVAPALLGEEAAKSGIFFILAIPVAFLITGLLGYLLEILLIRRLYGRPLDTLLATWGVGLIIQQVARSYDSRNVPVTSPSWLDGGLMITETLILPYKRLFIIALVITVVIGLYFFLYRSVYGMRIRAVMQNREIASALGTADRRVDAYTFALGAGLAGVAGCALTLLGQIGPQLGTGYIV